MYRVELDLDPTEYSLLLAAVVEYSHKVQETKNNPQVAHLHDESKVAAIGRIWREIEKVSDHE